jgi:hypothetical protein
MWPNEVGQKVILRPTLEHKRVVFNLRYNSNRFAPLSRPFEYYKCKGLKRLIMALNDNTLKVRPRAVDIQRTGNTGADNFNMNGLL